ncbi:hypothetical protein SAMN02910357_01475 [Succinivibrio dextrinosolvens]|uniref:acyloxyacyl hydrolase n=1 Tax=Succinivibrio dextrinosolvens TaxID=83771 RepID=UPI0008E90B4A|nr:acyloxyacyl hydrolase [Succinivibrio dextrinosolvens]SFS72118.1 hypothetical protein SAMN02910357_01475 [Succinivibrio dextrinosolvens]
MITLNKLSKACVVSSLLFMGSLAYAETSCVEGWDFQAEYLKHKKSNKHVDNYNLHVYKHFWNNDYLSFYYGGTATIANGYMNNKGIKDNSDAFGIGPSILGRLEFNPFGNFYTGLELGGTMRFFTKSHPAGGRAYDFLWRVGPRFSYKLNNDSAIGLSFLYAHASNGMSSHNPGYEMLGVNLDLEYKF